jgi:hypothetical protein
MVKQNLYSAFVPVKLGVISMYTFFTACAWGTITVIESKENIINNTIFFFHIITNPFQVKKTFSLIVEITCKRSISKGYIFGLFALSCG